MDLTILICTYNRHSQLRETLQHFRQIVTDKAWELIVVDNASTDETKAVIHEAQQHLTNVKYHYETRRGLGAARDCGWRLASSDIIAFTDDDCYPSETYVDDCLKVFQETDIGYAGGRILLWDPNDLPITIDTREIPEYIPPYSFLPTGILKGANLMLRREVLIAIDGFDPRLGAGTPFPCEDIDVIAAASWSGWRGKYDPRPLVFHHHRRRQEHKAGIWKSYDAGRGAYYMKYILRQDTRKVYLRAWLKRAYEDLRNKRRTQLSREIRSAIGYAVSRLR